VLKVPNKMAGRVSSRVLKFGQTKVHLGNVSVLYQGKK